MAQSLRRRGRPILGGSLDDMADISVCYIPQCQNDTVHFGVEPKAVSEFFPLDDAIFLYFAMKCA